MNSTRHYIQLLGILLLTIIMGAAVGLFFDIPGRIWNPPTANSASPQYSCSMHPEVMSAEAGNCPKCGMKLVQSSPQAGHESCCHDGQNQASCCSETSVSASSTNLILPPGHPPVPGWTISNASEKVTASTNIPVQSSH